LLRLNPKRNFYKMIEYNTQKELLPLPEYGRSVQNMVDHALTIVDRAERQRCANTIVNIMGGMFPHLRDVPDFKHKLWDHLAIMARFNLDVDYPVEIIRAEKLESKPDTLPYPSNRIRYRHYGALMQQLIKKTTEFPEGEERDHLTLLTANHMKKCYMSWNKDGVMDKKIFKDLDDLTEGALKLDDSTVRLVSEVRNFVPRKGGARTNNNNGKKKY